MTDTGQIPGEGLPENGVGEAGLPPHTGLPGNGVPQQSGWGADALTDPLTDPLPELSGHGGAAYGFLEQPPAPVAGIDDEEDVLLMPGLQGSWSDPQPVPPPAPMPAAAPISVEVPTEVPVETPAPVPPPVARRPLHMGPPLPDTPSGGVSVRSLADRGPAVPGPPASGPEYFDVPRDGTAGIPAQQTAEPGSWAAATDAPSQQSLIPRADSVPQPQPSQVAGPASAPVAAAAVPPARPAVPAQGSAPEASHGAGFAVQGAAPAEGPQFAGQHAAAPQAFVPAGPAGPAGPGAAEAGESADTAERAADAAAVRAAGGQPAGAAPAATPSIPAQQGAGFPRVTAGTTRNEAAPVAGSPLPDAAVGPGQADPAVPAGSAHRMPAASPAPDDDGRFAAADGPAQTPAGAVMSQPGGVPGIGAPQAPGEGAPAPASGAGGAAGTGGPGAPDQPGSMAVGVGGVAEPAVAPGDASGDTAPGAAGSRAGVAAGHVVEAAWTADTGVTPVAGATAADGSSASGVAGQPVPVPGAFPGAAADAVGAVDGAPADGAPGTRAGTRRGRAAAAPAGGAPSMSGEAGGQVSVTALPPAAQAPGHTGVTSPPAAGTAVQPAEGVAPRHGAPAPAVGAQAGAAAQAPGQVASASLPAGGPGAEAGAEGADGACVSPGAAPALAAPADSPPAEVSSPVAASQAGAPVHAEGLPASAGGPADADASQAPVAAGGPGPVSAAEAAPPQPGGVPDGGGAASTGAETAAQPAQAAESAGEADNDAVAVESSPEELEERGAPGRPEGATQAPHGDGTPQPGTPVADDSPARPRRGRRRAAPASAEPAQVEPALVEHASAEPARAQDTAAPAAAADDAPGTAPADATDHAPEVRGAADPYEPAVRDAVHRVIRERRDIRNGFRSDPIPHDVLLRVLEAAHTAPSVGHSQPWDFVVIRSEKTRERMHELAMRQREAYAKSLPKARARQFRELKIEAILDTPVNIVVTADPTRGGRHTLGRHTQPQMAPYSSALAVENLWLAARAEGLGVGWVSFFDERQMVAELGLPEHLEVVAYLCVGYVDEFPQEPELMQAGWSQRRPLSWVVHEEEYGNRALPGEEPHDLLEETLRGIRPLDAKALGEAWERQKRMTKPAGALGMLEIISAQLSGLSRKCPPPIPEPAAVAIFAGDHGVHAQGVTPWPQEVTGQMVANFLGGGAVCNAFANQVGAEVCVIDVGVASELPSTPGLLPRKVRPGTADFTAGPAMTREEALRAVEVGIETARDLVAAGNKALLTGEMGIANTTTSAALIAVFTGVDPAEVTGRGTGINDEMHARKVEVVRRALELHRPDAGDPIAVLAAIGGLEHAAMVGLLLGAAALRTPVILDGVSAGAAALVARAIAPEVLAACIAGHRSAEPGHAAALTTLGLRPLVDLDLRLGEGTGALLALPLVQSAARVMHEVATFDAAGVTEKS